MSPPLSVERGPDSERAPDPRARGAQDVVRLLVKAQKASRLYEGKNEISDRLERELFERLVRHLDEHGEIHLNVQEFVLRFDDAVIYESDDRNHSLAFLLYRDGIRRLSFFPGVTREEVRALLDCLNRVAVLSNEQDDLVTLLWEQELHAIRYFAIEDLDTDVSYPRLEEQLASGRLAADGAGSRGEGGAEGGVKLDLAQPLTTLPVEASRLDDEDIEALQQELAKEESAPFHQLVSELVLELTLLETEEESLAELRQSLLAIVDRLIQDGEILDLTGIHEHLIGLSTMVFANEPTVAKLVEEVQTALAEPERLGRVLERVDNLHVPKPDALTAFFARLGADRADTLLEWMGRFASPAYRRAVTNALLAASDGGCETLARVLPDGPPPPAETPEHLRHRQFVREVLHAITQHSAEEAVPLLERLVGSVDHETRRESFSAICRYDDDRVEKRCLEALLDDDAEIRSTALDTLVRRAKPEHGAAILERVVGSGFDERPLAEKRRLLAAAAKLGGDSILPKLSALLRDRDDGWFTSSKEKHSAEAVAHGVRMVGTEEARGLLEECASDGSRAVKSACQKELALWR